MKQRIQASREREVLSLISGITFSSTPVWYNATRRDLKMDVLFPKHHTQHRPCPAIIWVCGGAFQSVDRSVWIPELEGFARSCGAEVCRRAIDTAVDNGRATWPYIRAILRDKQARGIHSLAQWDAWEERRQHGGHDGIHRETAQEKYHGVGTDL